MEVSVSALARPGVEGKKKYIIIPGMKDTPATDIQFEEYANELVHALGDKGYIQVTNPDDAQLVILVGYSISDPINRQVTGVAAVDSTQTSETNATATVGFSVNPVMAHGTTETSSTSYVPTMKTVTTYRRTLIILAADPTLQKAKSPDAEQWREVITSDGSSSDLRQAMPVMISAASNYFGQDSHKAIVTRIGLNDKNVKFVIDGVTPH